MRDRVEKYIINAAIVIVAIAICVAIWNWYHQPQPAQKTYTTAAPIPAAAKIKKQIVPVKKIIVLDKKQASKKLMLPDAVAQDNNTQILATAQIPETDTTGKTDIVAVMDTGSGATEIISKQQPQSFFAVINQKAIGIRLGINGGITSFEREADIYGRWDILRTGAVRWGLYGEVNSRGDGRAMISAEYRF
jgi:hypothetical protein